MIENEVNKISERIKKHIHEEKNGYCRVGWAIKEEMSKGYKVRVADKTRVSALLINTGEYYMLPSKYDENDNDIFPVNKLDLKMKKLKLKTFWLWLFFAVFGGIYSAYDFIERLSKQEANQYQQIPKAKMESELSKSHILILDQKNLDSLRSSKTHVDSSIKD